MNFLFGDFVFDATGSIFLIFLLHNFNIVIIISKEIFKTAERVCILTYFEDQIWKDVKAF